jgi:hypothetical protein
MDPGNEKGLSEPLGCSCACHCDSFVLVLVIAIAFVLVLVTVVLLFSSLKLGSMSLASWSTLPQCCVIRSRSPCGSNVLSFPPVRASMSPVSSVPGSNPARRSGLSASDL